MTDADHEALDQDLEFESEGVAENFIARNPLTALAIALLVGAMAAKALMKSSGTAHATRPHDPLPE